MKTTLLAGCALASALALSGCGTIGTAEPPSVTIKALAEAGCAGSFVISFGGATGQLGGGVHADNTFTGACDPAKAKPALIAGPAGAAVGAALALPPQIAPAEIPPT
jgi:DNA-binding transcriptional regulator LsrR (DeoR family)